MENEQFEENAEQDLADRIAELEKQNKALAKQLKEFQRAAGPRDGFKPETQQLIDDFLKYIVDPSGAWIGVDSESILSKVDTIVGNKVAAIDSVGGINYSNKGLDYDPYLINFIYGSGGTISNWDKEKETDNTLVIRGLGGGSRKAIQHCWSTGREFYAIDTGYYGNGKSKNVHRVTKNALQQLGPIVERPLDRAKRFGYKFKKFTSGGKILLVPPSQKVMTLFGQPSPEEWVNQVVEELKQYTDRPIEIRLKPSRSDRVSTNTIQDALADDVHCLITYNSIAAVEALMEGKPAIVLGQNAASVVAETDLANVENPARPDRETMNAYMAHLAYCQFTVEEFKSGFAWKTVNESSQLPLWYPSQEQ